MILLKHDFQWFIFQEFYLSLLLSVSSHLSDLCVHLCPLKVQLILSSAVSISFCFMCHVLRCCLISSHCFHWTLAFPKFILYFITQSTWGYFVLSSHIHGFLLCSFYLNRLSFRCSSYFYSWTFCICLCFSQIKTSLSSDAGLSDCEPQFESSVHWSMTTRLKPRRGTEELDNLGDASDKHLF